jgi:O-methyltransferase
MITKAQINTDELRSLYLNLIKSCLLDSIHKDTQFSRLSSGKPLKRLFLKTLEKRGLNVVKKTSSLDREGGKDWPLTAHTMVGEKRLQNLQECVENVIKDEIPGDLIETGVWRGGASILMRAVLKSYGIEDRKVWVADSFRGLPPPTSAVDKEYSSSYIEDNNILAVSLQDVKNNFAAYGLLDESVKFLEGWFRDTLPSAPIDKLALVRLDGDLYESTMDGLTYLYPKLSEGGYLIVDDFNSVEACKKAVVDYRRQHDIQEKIVEIDSDGVFWRKNPKT